MRIVLDTNVLVRATENATGPAREILGFFERKRATLVLSPYILQELARVLTYPRLAAIHRLTPEKMLAFLKALESIAELVPDGGESPASIVTNDPDDDAIVQLAVRSGVAVLCTRDRHLHSADVLAYCEQHGVRVLDDISLLAELRQGDAP